MTNARQSTLLGLGCQQCSGGSVVPSLLGMGCPDCGGTCGQQMQGLGDAYNVIGHSLRHDTKYVPVYHEPGSAAVHYIKPTFYIGTIAGFNSKKTWLKLKDGRWVYIGNFFNEFRVSEKPVKQEEESTLEWIVRNTIGAVVPTAQASAAVLASAAEISAEKAVDFAISVGNVLKIAVPALLVIAGVAVYSRLAGSSAKPSLGGVDQKPTNPKPVKRTPKKTFKKVIHI